MSSTRIEQLIDDVQAAFDRHPTDIETGLDVDDAALLQLRKACRLLAGAEELRDASYDTVPIFSSLWYESDAISTASGWASLSR
jgi:hypothetical protein